MPGPQPLGVGVLGWVLPFLPPVTLPGPVFPGLPPGLLLLLLLVLVVVLLLLLLLLLVPLSPLLLELSFVEQFGGVPVCPEGQVAGGGGVGQIRLMRGTWQIMFTLQDAELVVQVPSLQVKSSEPVRPEAVLLTVTEPPLWTVPEYEPEQPEPQETEPLYEQDKGGLFCGCVQSG